MKKLAVIGAGTQGCLSILHFLKYTNWEIDWYSSSKIKALAVGEGSTLDLPEHLNYTLDLNFNDIFSIDGTLKLGVRKIGWSSNSSDFMHYFPPSRFAYHFNAVKLQNLIFDRLIARNISRLKIHDQIITTTDLIDSDYILDCRGTPKDFTDYIMVDNIPVNSVYVTQCYWDYPTFQYTVANASNFGWVFLIPLKNRCSVGYLYNKDITDIELVKSDSENIFKKFSLIPSTDINSFSFNNYYKYENFVDRICYNGNASFFLEPLEATSLTLGLNIVKIAYDLWHENRLNRAQANSIYSQLVLEISRMISMHYAAGGPIDNQFWNYATNLGTASLGELIVDSKWIDIYNSGSKTRFTGNHYGLWTAASYYQNISGLKLEKYFK